MNTVRFLLNLSLAGCLVGAAGLVKAQASARCPPPEQPVLSITLEKMVRDGRADDALQCIIEIDDRQGDSDTADEVRYQLAKQASDAIESLGGDLTFAAYHDRATKLWRGYLDNVSAPFDKKRMSFGATKLMQHGRLGEFEQVVPVVIRSFSQNRQGFSSSQADQLFSILKRCPRWNSVEKTNGFSCTSLCQETARGLVEEITQNFDTNSKTNTDGAKRLLVNAKALGGVLSCTKQ